MNGYAYRSAHAADTEARYRTLALRLGGVMLVFFVAFTAFSVLISLVVPLFTDTMPYPVGTVVYELLYGVLYALCFGAPVFCFYLFSRRDKDYQPLDLSFTLPRHLLLYIFVAVAIVSAAGYVNSYLLELISFDILPDLGGISTGATTNVELVLMVFTMAIVPGFVEELLFRGVILRNMLPFGRTTAVIASAFLFGVMHQNPAQFFYTTVAGLVLGYIYVHTRSLWCTVIIHMCNNFLAVVYTVLGERLSSEIYPVVALWIELFVFVLGGACAVYLICRTRRAGAEVKENGVFAGAPPTDAEDTDLPLSLSRRVKLFFSAPMIIFLVLAALEMGALLLINMVL
ncbi:MAG: CPBP family intramembrane metalloprotease [Ruminococcaceae bacterium]|nr:CPBP family intramembrane metalloprotease [Oscillospiraceae bacterium]